MATGRLGSEAAAVPGANRTASWLESVRASHLPNQMAFPVAGEAERTNLETGASGPVAKVVRIRETGLPPIR
jgi:hypothetical protein